MFKKQPKVNILILQYNNSVDTLDCLWSLKNLAYSNFEVTIIDNDSKEEEVGKIKEYINEKVDKFKIELIETGVNLGYAGGNNIGMQKAFENGADCVFVLNNDTVVSPDFLEKLIEEAEKNPECGILGPKMNLYRYGPGEDEIWFSGAETKFLNTNIKHKTDEFDGLRETGFVPGAGMLIKKEVVEKIGYFDEDYFLYYEDMDYSLRARRAGYKVVCVSDSIIWHKVSRTVSALPDPKRLRYIFRNCLFLAGKLGGKMTKITIPCWIFYVSLKQWGKIILMPAKKEVSKAILAGLKDYVFNNVGNIDFPKKKIGIECSDLEGARYGVGKTLIRLTEYLTQNKEARNNFALYLYFNKKIPDDNILKHPLFRKKLLRIPKIPPSFNIFYHIYIPLVYWWHNLDLCLFFPYMLPAFFKGKSIVMLTNDVIYEIRNKHLPFKYRLGYGLFAWWAAKRADKIMTLSHYAKEIIAQHYRIEPRKIFVNTLGIDKIFDERPEELNIDETKRKLGLRKDFIAFVGQAFPRRRLKETLLAFSKIKNKEDDLQFLFVGTDKYPDLSLQKIVAKINEKFGQDTVICRHRLEENDLRSVYAGAKAVAYISTSEAQGLPPLEALKYGTPALLKDYELSREFFKDCAFYVKDETSVNEIALTMQRALNEFETIKKIKEGGRDIINHLTWKQCVEKLIYEIKQIA